MSADYTRNVSSSSSNNMHHVSSSSNKGGRPVSILPNMSLQNMSNWSNLVNMNMASMANMTNMSYPMMRPSVMVKQRKTNFTQREVDALINAVRQHQDTVLFGVAGGPGWAKAWTQVAAAVSAVEGIVRSEGDVRKKWTYLKWEAKNTSKPDRDSTSRAVLQILTSRQNQIDAANQHAAVLRNDMRVNDALRGDSLRGDSLRDAVQSSRSLLEELLVPPQPGTNAADGSPQPQPSASVGRPPVQPKQVDIKREQLSPRDRPSPHPAPAMPTPSSLASSMAAGQGHPQAHQQAHQQAQMPTPTPAHPRRSAPAQMRPPSPVLANQPAAPPPEVCLRWNSYHSNMQATFPSLLNNEQFVDVTLACEGHSIKCHKVMLSACSSYFEELLSQNPCQHPIVLMKDLRFWEVQALVDFMYRGEVNVTQDKLPSLLAAAEALQIKGLAGPATNSHDSEPSRGAYEDPLRRRKRRMPMPDPAELLPRNPVGRPRIHPKVPQRLQAPPVLQQSMTPRIQVRPEQQLQRPMLLDEGPPAQRMKHSPPASPAIKVETLETDLSNDSLDKMRYDVGDSGGSGDGSNHGDALVDLSQGRFSINNGLQSDRNRDHSDDLDNDQDDERNLDDDDDRDPDRPQDLDRNQLRDHNVEQDNEHDDDNDMEQDHENDQDRENEQALTMGGSEDDQDIHSSDEDQYDNEPPQDSRQQSDHLPDHLVGRL